MDAPFLKELFTHNIPLAGGGHIDAAGPATPAGREAGGGDDALKLILGDDAHTLGDDKPPPAPARLSNFSFTFGDDSNGR